MSLHPQDVPPVPADTMRVAQAAFPRGNLYLKLRDEIGVIFSDHDFAGLFPTRGQPAAAPWRLALVTLLQFTEGLSDRQAADAVRSRIDWKYALSLELTDPGFDSSVLCEFRTRLVVGHAEHLMLDTLLGLCRERQWLKARGRQRTDSTHVLAAVSACNRLQCAIETMRCALNSLAVVAPEWLASHSLSEWVDRYGPRALDHPTPTGQEQRRAHAEVIGADGWSLLSTVYAGEAPDWLRQVPAIETLRQVWVQQFCWQGATLRWRTEPEGVPPARLFLSSPYDRDAHLSQKRTTQWVGYKVHLTETCEDDTPHLITHVETTTAPIADGDMTGTIHHALQDKGLLPSVHLVDTGYLDADLLVASQREYQVDLLGPTRGDCKWQARAGTGFAASQFHLDWDRQQARCPAGATSISWTPAVDKRTNEVIKIKFSRKDCGGCSHRVHCTRGTRRCVTVRRQEQYEALQSARQRETTAAYLRQYQKRAGIEGTISQGVRAFGLRRARYIGLAKTHLQHLLTAAAINLVRINNWLLEMPLAKTRQSRFVRLMQPVPA